LLHGIAELAMRELCQELAELDPADQAGRQTLLRRWLESDLAGRTLAWMAEAAERAGLRRFFDPGLFASAGRKAYRQAAGSLEAMLRQYLQTDFRPALLEWTFGPDAAKGLALDLADGTTIAFRGKVDRIDLIDQPDGRQFRIIDYKSGDKAADFDSLYTGLSLQLPAYLEAFRRSRPDCRPADAAYFHFDRPVLRYGGEPLPSPEKLAASLEKKYALRGLRLPPDDLERLCRHSLRKAADLAGSLLAGDFRVAPRKLPKQKPACAFCDYAAICAFDFSPEGYYRLQPLRCRLNEAGKAVNKRQEMALRLREAEIGQEGSDHAVHA
jgi:ATP-dependent helicase/DNAse subunit B